MTDTPISPHERATHARHGYSSLQITYHWSIVVLVAVNWLVGQGMEEVYLKREAGEYLAIFLTMIARLVTRLNRPVETAGDSKHKILKLLGWLNHWAFYAVLLAMPPLGVLAWFFAADWAAAAHSFLAWTLPFLIVLHVGGAVLHLILGENIIRRIVRPTAGT